MGTVIIENEVEVTSEAQRLIIEILKAKNFPFTVRVTSGSRREPGSDHDYSTATALDLAAEWNTTSPAPHNREIARLFDSYGPKVKQLIHSTLFDDDNGFYWSSGVRVSGGFFNEPNLTDPDGHHTHIHISINSANAKEVLKKILKDPQEQPETSYSYSWFY